MKDRPSAGEVGWMIQKTNIIKISLFAFSALLSFLIWSRFSDAFESVGVLDITFSMFLFVLSVGYFILLLFMFSDWLPLGIFSVFLFVFVAIFGFGAEYFVASFLAILFFVYAKIRLEHNIKNNLKIRFHSAILYGASSLVTAFAILVAFASYTYPFNVSEINVSAKWFSQVTPISEKFIQLQMPYYESGMTTDDFLAEGVAKEFGVSADVIKRNYKTQLSLQRDELAESLGIELLGEETLEEVMALLANSYVNKYLSPNPNIVPVVFAILIFLAIKSFGFFLNRISVFFAWGLFKTLKVSKILETEITQVDKETLTLR